jgi:hypothetical protein
MARLGKARHGLAGGDAVSQTDGVLAMLKANPHGVTPMDALREVGTLRLAARIADLRAEGYVISTTSVKRGRARVALYRLVRFPPIEVAS